MSEQNTLVAATTKTKAYCYPHGMGDEARAILCDDYYSWNETPTGKVRGFVFYFEDCAWPILYFVPCEPYSSYRSTELNLEDALESWIDHLFDSKSNYIIGGGFEGSQSLAEYARENDLTEEETMNRMSWGASYYCIESEGWQCRETWIDADGLDGVE